MRAAADQGAEAGESLRADAVEGPDAALLAVDEPGVVEDLGVRRGQEHLGD
jgi:hypothetical protein